MTTASRRRREHFVRQGFRLMGWYTLAHRHRRRKWRTALKEFRGKRTS